MQRLFLIFISLLLLLPSCKRDELVINLSASGYPNNVGKIILSKCAVAGCHNNLSKDAASGLSLETWDQMMEGGRNGPCVIPYRSDFSTLCFFTNTYSDFGVAVAPTMPINEPPLSREEYVLLRDWIANGAQNNQGFVKFSDNPLRKKIYVVNKLCEVVTVFDSETMLPMRYIDVGKNSGVKFPESIQVSPDGQYWYVAFLAANFIQKYRCSDDAYMGNIYLGTGIWNTFCITPDSKKAFVLDNSTPGQIAYIDLQNMWLISMYQNGGNFKYPRGAVINSTNTVLYAGALQGNFIYKIDISNPNVPVISEKQIDGTTISQYNNLYDVYDIALSPDGKKYYVACQYSNEIRVMQVSNDSLLAVIPVGYYPQQMSFSTSHSYLFVTSPQDTLSFAGKRGSVTVINYQSNSIVTKIYAGWESYGIAVDESRQVVCVSNMNLNTGGPGPHHSTNCGGRNGYVTFIDLNMLTVLPKKTELANLPYSVAVRK